MIAKNIPAIFWNRYLKDPEKTFLKVKRQGRYIDISYERAGRVISDLYYGLKALDIHSGDCVAIISENRPEWLFADLAILSAGAITVPLYDTASPKQVEYVLEDSNCRIVFVSHEMQLLKVLKVCDGLSGLEKIVVMDDFNPELREKGIFPFFEIMRIGNDEKKQNRYPVPYETPDIRPDRIATIIYTSGTTGMPKGVALSHHNILSNIDAALQVLHLDENDTCLSFLPLSHVFERTDGYYLMINAGVTIAMAETPETIPGNLVEIKPTVMISVPRLYEKMYGRILSASETSSFLKKIIFKVSLCIGRKASEQLQKKNRTSLWIKIPYTVANFLVFSKLKNRLGGRIRFFISGGGALEPDIARFFHAAGVIILEGYGLTETSPVVTVNRLNSYRFGSIGKPIPDVEVKLGKDNEILVRGPGVMMGYVNDPETTQEVIDIDGWFHTGDLGYFDDEGFLYITGRKKEILVLSTGKNISPVPIENSLNQHRFINQSMVVGDKKKFVSAIIVPDFEQLEKYCKDQHIECSTRDQFLANTKVNMLFEDAVKSVSENLARHEKIKKFKLINREFDMVNGEITPTLKLRRDKILENFRDIINEIYGESS